EGAQPLTPAGVGKALHDALVLLLTGEELGNAHAVDGLRKECIVVGALVGYALPGFALKGLDEENKEEEEGQAGNNDPSVRMVKSRISPAAASSDRGISVPSKRHTARHSARPSRSSAVNPLSLAGSVTVRVKFPVPSRLQAHTMASVSPLTDGNRRSNCAAPLV
ncbi:MAG: hypothetical protein IKI93_18340, partial [Clostridia bacterium]|nr:hypothetical protein [Clostridia bacterium]